MNACTSGKMNFVAVHGEKEINFSEAIKSKSNSIPDYFWFLRRQELSEDQKNDLQLFAIECAERVLPIFEIKYPDDKRPRTAIETAKLYLSKQATIDDLEEARWAAADAAFAADATSDAAHAAHAAFAAAYYADAAYAEKQWQIERLAEIVLTWENAA